MPQQNLTETKTLHQTLLETFGSQPIKSTAIPQVITENLNPAFNIRPYQKKTFQFYLTYWHEIFNNKPKQNHQLLFHMATGSGKTLIMAGLMLHLYAQGYRNFLFFVNSNNVINKTRDNFLNPLSQKYLFAKQLKLSDRTFTINEVNNFQTSNPNDINIVFSTIQGLHNSLNEPSENAITYDDFENQKIVLISDEAHHINADTKKGKNLNQLELSGFKSDSWEGTIKLIFGASHETCLFEFTATIDFAEDNLAKKYRPLLIYDYTLKEFRQDGYSKEVKTRQADLPEFERALQAVILSQYRRKIFEKNRLLIKPVILFKSKTIKESEVFFADFKNKIANITANQIEKILQHDDPYLRAVIDYLTLNKITLDDFAQEIRSDFSENKLIEVNSKSDSENKQLIVNTLESPQNEYRAVFAVDMLNEGWDVLNLFDIVRLYDTRDSRAGKPFGKTTMSEAQLIGRGARYCPFKLTPDQPLDQRKFDADLTNEMRICEELIYHSSNNPKYIWELNEALREIGITAATTKQRTIMLKDSFKNTSIYKAGFLFLNEQEKFDCSKISGLDSEILQKLYEVTIHTGKSKYHLAFEDENKSYIEYNREDYSLTKFGVSILRKAIQRLDFFEFNNLKKRYPIKSMYEFMTSENYLGSIKVEVSKDKQNPSLSADDKLYAVTQVLEEIHAKIIQNKIEYQGTKEFKPYMIKDKITDKILNFAIEDRGAEYGKSMNNPRETNIHLDLSVRDWFVFDDCYGTSEEKLLVRYIDKNYLKLKERYSEVYLIRNERHFKIYNFDDGRPFEPDFILYLIGYKKTDTMHYQIFIEPKGQHLIKDDTWKEDFLKQIMQQASIEQLWKSKEYVIWGLPFFNSAQETEFDKEFSQLYKPE